MTSTQFFALLTPPLSLSAKSIRKFGVFLEPPIIICGRHIWMAPYSYIIRICGTRQYLSPASLPAGSDDLLEVPGRDRLQDATHRHDLGVLGTVAILKEETYNVNKPS